MIRISQIHEDSKQGMLVEGTLSGEWVDVVEESWLEAQRSPNGAPVHIDLSGVTYIDDKGRDLLARMIRDGAELRATGVMTKAVIEEITEQIAMARNGRIPDGAQRGGSDDNDHNNMFAASADKSETVGQRSGSGGACSCFFRLSRNSTRSSTRISK